MFSVQGWKRRWFVLDRSDIAIYKNDSVSVECRYFSQPNFYQLSKKLFFSFSSVICSFMFNLKLRFFSLNVQKRQNEEEINQEICLRTRMLFQWSLLCEEKLSEFSNFLLK